MNKTIKNLCAGYGEIFFITDKKIGGMIALVTLLNPRAALAAGVCLVAAYLTSRALHMGEQFLASGHYIYNALLVGFSLAYLPLSGRSILLIITAGIATYLVTLALADIMLKYLKLSVLSLPFVIISTIYYIACYPYLGASTIAENTFLPWWLAGYFRSLATILFSSQIILGIFLSIAICLYSRILFLLSLVGYFGGALVHIYITGSPLMYGPYHFNYMLIAMAIGGVLLVPVWQSYVIALMIVCVSVVVQECLLIMWQPLHVPLFTLPFNITALTIYYVFYLVQHPLLNTFGETPEANLDRYQCNRLRFPGTLRTLSPPFSGCWTVWQGFSGQWTHQGIWRYAYDFVVTDEKGNTFRGEGCRLQDYYCYRKSVLSPVSGTVIKVIDKLPDNKIGAVNEENKWGNLVIIQDYRGFFVEISHFAYSSIRVAEGDIVERGSFLGLCGNSGYSPQPHIHIQVQETAEVGAATMPFSFTGYLEDAEYRANDLPALGLKIEVLPVEKHLVQATTFLLDDIIEYQVIRENNIVEQFSLKVKIAADGSFYFESENGKLYFGKHESTFYFYRIEGNDPWLNKFFLAAPRIPLCYKNAMAWNDYLPVSTVTSPWLCAAMRLLGAFLPRLTRVKVRQRFDGINRMRSRIDSNWLRPGQRIETMLDGQGFISLKTGDIEIRRKNYENLSGNWVAAQ